MRRLVRLEYEQKFGASWYIIFGIEPPPRGDQRGTPGAGRQRDRQRFQEIRLSGRRCQSRLQAGQRQGDLGVAFVDEEQLAELLNDGRRCVVKYPSPRRRPGSNR
jgi:hypothetical protein